MSKTDMSRQKGLARDTGVAQPRNVDGPETETARRDTTKANEELAKPFRKEDGDDLPADRVGGLRGSSD